MNTVYLTPKYTVRGTHNEITGVDLMLKRLPRPEIREREQY